MKRPRAAGGALLVPLPARAGLADDLARWKLLPANDLIRRAHRLGLPVHSWTFRNEQKRLPSDYQGNPNNRGAPGPHDASASRASTARGDTGLAR